MAKTVMIFGAGASAPFFDPPLSTCALTSAVQNMTVWKHLLDRYKDAIGNLGCPVSPDSIAGLIQRSGQARRNLDFEELIGMVDIYSSYAIGDSVHANTVCGIAPKRLHSILKLFGVDQPCDNNHCWDFVPFLFRQLIAETIETWHCQSKSPEYYNLITKQSELFSYQLKHRNLSVYTFNYDDILPQTDIVGEIPLESGFDKGRFDSVNFLKAPSVLAYLHGHARWTLDDGGVRSFPSMARANRWRLEHLSNAGFEETIHFVDGSRSYDFNTFLTTGLDKESSFNRDPYSAYYQRIAKDLMYAEAVVFVGYSFRDPHIDGLLLNFLDLDPGRNKVLVIDRWNYDIDLQSEFTNPFGSLRRVLEKHNVTSIPFTRFCSRRINSCGYGPFCRQVWIYKKGYGNFLLEWETVLDEWRRFQDP